MPTASLCDRTTPVLIVARTKGLLGPEKYDNRATRVSKQEYVGCFIDVSICPSHGRPPRCRIIFLLLGDNRSGVPGSGTEVFHDEDGILVRARAAASQVLFFLCFFVVADLSLLSLL